MCSALVSVLVALNAPGVSAAATKHKKKGPTLQQQIAAAVAKAERSPDLWATVNCCGTCPVNPPSNDVIAIRGQMPGLGKLASTMSMTLSVSFWSTMDNLFEPANVQSTISLGKLTGGLHQGGVNFPFSPPPTGTTYLLRGTVTFSWKIGRRVVGSVTRNTGHGYAGVGFSVPPGTSEGTCTLS